LIVFFDAGVDASSATDAAADIQTIHEFDTVERRWIHKVRAGVVPLLHFPPDAIEDLPFVVIQYLQVRVMDSTRRKVVSHRDIRRPPRDRSILSCV
jgi:hypothetical protein